MATRTSSLASTNVSDTTFRLWINEIHNSLIAFGWVQTSDTGQINFSTVLRPAAINTYQGYAVYRMADSLQATCAVYMRLDFGTGSTSDTPSIKIRLTIGSTDGAGTLTGNLSTQVTTSTNTGGGATTFACRTSGSTSSFRMHFWSTSVSGCGWTLAVERDRDASGAETSLGVNILVCWPSTTSAFNKNSQFLELAGGTGSQDAAWYGMLSNQTSQSAGGVVGIAPVHTQLGPMRNPMIGIVLVARTDFQSEVTYPMAVYGVTHTYLMLRPHLGSSTVLLNLVNSDTGFGMLWE
jgi:hypothetical protein